MSSSTTPKSDRSQTLTAVLFMSLLAIAILIFVLAKDISSFVCGYEIFKEACTNQTELQTANGLDQVVESEITTACVDTNGLKISVLFGALLSGDANIQVFTTGEDVFPSEQGMSDSYEGSKKIQDATDSLDFVIPVETMPVGEQIFGNIVTSDANGISSHVAYFIEVSDCATTGTENSNRSLSASRDIVPANFNAICLPSNKLMISFGFDQPVSGQYQARVADESYQLASVGNQPVVLFFSGDPPGVNPAAIKLVSTANQDVIFEETHTLPVCDPES